LLRYSNAPRHEPLKKRNANGVKEKGGRKKTPVFLPLAGNFFRESHYGNAMYVAPRVTPRFEKKEGKNK